jgi:16S rRNA processing protein RimM
VAVIGVVGRPHGLDGSFHVTAARGALLHEGAVLTVAGAPRTIERRAGTDEHPIVRLSGCGARGGGAQLEIEDEALPPLGPDEYWAEELEGATVLDGERELGVVRRLLALPSCECLEVARAGGGPDLLVPLVRDAIRSIDVAAARIDVDSRFLGET